jgi:Flp pilus assembly pilin Flp
LYGSYSGYGDPIAVIENSMITLLAARIRMLLGWSDSERGQALVEYSLIMCLVVIVVLITLIVQGAVVSA